MEFLNRLLDNPIDIVLIGVFLAIIIKIMIILLDTKEEYTFKAECNCEYCNKKISNSREYKGKPSDQDMNGMVSDFKVNLIHQGWIIIVEDNKEYCFCCKEHYLKWLERGEQICHTQKNT